jgi:hypothetical protein
VHFIKFLAENGRNRWQLPVERQSRCDENLPAAVPSRFENVSLIEQQFRWAFDEVIPKARSLVH